MKRKSLSMAIVLILILALTNQFVLASDYKDGTSEEYMTNFEKDLVNHPDIDVNLRNYLKADYYQTKAFNGLNLVGETDVPEDSNWELFASNILKSAYNGVSFSSDVSTPLGYGAAVFNEILDIDAVTGLPKLTSPYGKKITATGYFVPTETRDYTIGAISDEGIRLTFDGDVYDTKWTYTDSGYHSYDVGILTVGMIYPIQIEYFENQQEGAMFTLLVNKMTTEDIKGYFYPKMSKATNYSLTVLVNQIGGLDDNTAFDYVEPFEFNELVDLRSVGFMSYLYNNVLAFGEEYKVDPKHIDGYIYEIYQKTSNLVPVEESNIFEEKVNWLLIAKECDELPIISGHLVSDETYAVNYIPYGYKVEFNVHPNSVETGSVLPTENLLLDPDDIKVVTAVPDSGYEFVQWWGEFEVPATDAEIAKALEDDVALLRQLKLLPIIDLDQSTDTFVADGSIVAKNGEIQLMDKYIEDKEFVYDTNIFAEFKVNPNSAVVVDEETPEDVPVLDAELVDDELPEAGGIPMEMITLVGVSVLGIGLVIKKRK